MRFLLDLSVVKKVYDCMDIMRQTRLCLIRFTHSPPTHRAEAAAMSRTLKVQLKSQATPILECPMIQRVVPYLRPAMESII
jgi:hypothetical protein